MLYFLSEISVIGQKQQPFGIIIKSSHGINSFQEHRRSDRRPSAALGDHAGWLRNRQAIQRNVNHCFFAGNYFTIHADDISSGIGFGSQLSDYNVVHAHAAGRNQLLRMAPRINAGSGE